jgi:hypothetical protein
MERSEVTVVCGWCGEMISSGGERISHGICVSCAMDFMRRLPRAFLERIADPDGTVTLFSGKKLPIDGSIKPFSL